MKQFGQRILACILLSGCTALVRAAEAPTSRPIRLTTSAPIALVPPTFELRPGVLVGGHAVNPDGRYTLVHEWQKTFTLEPSEFNHALRDELRTLGYQPATGSVAPFGLQPVVTRLVYNVFGQDPSVGWSEAEIAVRWQVLGPEPYAFETRGSAMTQQHSLSSVFQAFRISLRNFLADPRFSGLVSGSGMPRPAVIVPADPVRPAITQNPSAEPPSIPPPVATPAGGLERLRRPPEPAKTLDATGAAQRARASVVTVLAGDSWGSGIIVSAEGLVLTEATLVAGGSGITIVTATGNKAPATLVRADARIGVALIRVTGLPLDPLPMNLMPVDGGAAITAIGTPFHPALSFSVSQGRVTSVGNEEINTDVRISQGNGGGPIIDSRARGIAMVVWRGGTSESAQALAVSAGVAFKALGLAYADADPP